MAELQERARNMLSEGCSKSPLLNLVEELCTEGDRIIGDAKKDHDDLVQQVRRMHFICTDFVVICILNWYEILDT